MVRFHMNYFREYIESFLEISDKEWEYINSLYAKKYFKKGDIVFYAGDYVLIATTFHLVAFALMVLIQKEKNLLGAYILMNSKI